MIFKQLVNANPQSNQKLLQRYQDYFQNDLDHGRLPQDEKILNSLLLKDEFEISQEQLLVLHLWKERVTSLTDLRPYLLDSDIREIIIHGPQFIQVEKKGVLSPLISIPALTKNLLITLGQYHCLKVGKEWNISEPFQSFNIQLADIPIRLTITHDSISASSSIKLFLRKIQNVPLPLEAFIPSEHMIKIFCDLVSQKKNILIAGATGSGKTTFVSSLLQLIENHEHLLVLEDTHEIGKSGPNQTNLIADPRRSKCDLKSYMSYALRMRPDRIIIGELRSAEVVPFILAMNTGHNGLLSTVHANSAREALHRVAMLFTLFSESSQLGMDTILKLVCTSLDYVVFLKNREVSEILEVYGSDGTNPLSQLIYPAI